MSTRATIKLTYQAGNTIQLYHHCDGYPEYMGKLLESFCNTAFFMKYSAGIDTAMYNLLKMEKHFEFEDDKIRHGDIEYIWYVKLEEDGYEITYTEINPKFDELMKIQNQDEYEQKEKELMEKLYTSTKGEKLYA